MKVRSVDNCTRLYIRAAKMPVWMGMEKEGRILLQIDILPTHEG